MRPVVAGRPKKPTEIFIDRETIGWGENWRDRIAESVTSAMVFIPVVSIQYFDRESCRTELQAFHAAAKNRGVTDLLLPLVALGSRHITQESDDPLVRIVEELQNIDIRAAILAGTSTGIVTSRTAQLQEAAPETGRVVAVELANDVTALALDIQQLGAVIETAVSEIDADVRQYYSLVMQFGSPEMRETMGKDIAESGAQFSELNETAVVIAEFLEQMKPVEILNAPLRRSLRPLRTGVVSMQMAIATTQSWGRIGT